MPLEGSLKEFSLFEVLSLLKVAGKTGKLKVTSRDDRYGEIYLMEGKPVHAVFGKVIGEDALQKMIKLRDGYFNFTVGPITSERTITMDTEELINVLEQREKELKGLIEKIGEINKYLAYKETDEDAILTAEEWNFLPVAFSGKTVAEIAEEYEKGELRAYQLTSSLIEKGIVKLSDTPTILAVSGNIPAETTTRPSVEVTQPATPTTSVQPVTTVNKGVPRATPEELEQEFTVMVNMKAYMSTTGVEICWLDAELLKEWAEKLGRPVKAVEIVSPLGKKSKIPVEPEEGLGDRIYLLPITSFRLRISENDKVKVKPIPEALE